LILYQISVWALTLDRGLNFFTNEEEQEKTDYQETDYAGKPSYCFDRLGIRRCFAFHY